MKTLTENDIADLRARAQWALTQSYPSMTVDPSVIEVLADTYEEALEFADELERLREELDELEDENGELIRELGKRELDVANE